MGESIHATTDAAGRLVELHRRRARPGAPAPEGTLSEVMACLDGLGRASHRHDAEAYRAGVQTADEYGLSDEQVKDAWLYGWLTWRPSTSKGYPPFDWRGDPIP